MQICFSSATKSLLHLKNGRTPEEYYGTISEELAIRWDATTEHLLRTDDMICLGGEEELSNMLMGNFEAFDRVDCDLRESDVFRWGWESWRSAVGNEIGQIYPHAISLMNVGAQTNGKVQFSV